MAKDIMQEIVSLAVEIIDSGASAMDQTVERTGGSTAGRYDKRTWAIDVMTLLPNDRDDARSIIKAHCPGEVIVDDPRRVNRLIREYYKRLERTSLVTVGCRMLHHLK